MPRIPRDADPGRIVRFLRRRGFVLEQGARHMLLKRGDIIVPVPRHGPIGTGLMGKIIRESGIPIEEWLRGL